MHETLEHQEHAEHAAEHGSKRAALVIAVLAACLAISEQQAKHADIGVVKNAVLAANSWSEYQAKSIRAAMAQDLQRLAGSMDTPMQAEKVGLREKELKQLQTDQDHYEHDKETGKQAIALRARAFDEARDTNTERAHSFDNAAAALELGIVLASASVITSSRHLLHFAYLMGSIGVVLAVAAATAPGLLVF